MTQDRIAVVDLADDLHVQKQWLFKIVKRLGIQSARRREPARGGQRVATVTPEEAALIRQEVQHAESRSSRRTTSVTENPQPPTAGEDSGCFYIIQLEPQQDPGRFKVGFTLDLEARLRKHRTAAPFAHYVKTWRCRRTWERAAIDCVTAGCQQLHTEVFRTESLPDIIRCSDEFFALMPVSSI